VDQSIDKEVAEPPLIFLSKQEVLRRIPVTAVTLWQWVRSNRFPKPVAISENKVGWIEAEVDQWMRQRPTKQYKPL
jgi:prophage regulatory protein